MPQTARQAAKQRIANGFWIDHAKIVDDDLLWLRETERLTLWNVKLPNGFLARLPKLWWLDIRGGTAENLTSVHGAIHLEYLAVNQVRGLSDLSVIKTCLKVRFLSLYGLAKVSGLPSLADSENLERVEIGQMRALLTLAPLLDAPRLKELLLIRKLNVTSPDVARIAMHPTLERFDWFTEDVPTKYWKPVLDAVRLPPARLIHPEEWFNLEDEDAT